MNRSKKKSFDWYGVRQRFSIRKYHIGAASVLLGMTLAFGTGVVVNADGETNTAGTTSENVQPASDGTSSAGTAEGTAEGTAGTTSDNTGSTETVAYSASPADGTTNPTVDESVIKFPTQDNQVQPAGYQKVEFSTAYSTLVFEGKPGEIEITRGRKQEKVVVFWVKTGTTWGALKRDLQFRMPKYTVANGDFILGYARSVGGKAQQIDFDSLNDTAIVDTWHINTTVDYIVGDVSDGKTFEEYMNSGSYAPFHIPQFHGITLNANGGTVGGKAKKAFYVAYEHVQWGDKLVTSKIVDPSRKGYTFVRWQTDTGEGIPTSGQIETIEFTAVWLKHPTEAVKVFNSAQLSETDKTKVADLIRSVNPDLQNSIQEITVADNGDATVRFTTGEERTILGASLVLNNSAEQRAEAKKSISDAVLQKQDEIANSQLTAKEQQDKLAELTKLQESIEQQIDEATSEDALDKIVKDGKNSIENFDLTSATKKTAAKQDLEAAYNAKKAEIANSGLTAEEKATKLAELDKAKEDATKSIDTATTDDSVHKALTEGKSTIAAIDTTASPKKTAAKQDLETAYNAKKAEIENSALTAEEKAAKQAELDQVKSAADRTIAAATDNAGVAKALEDGKSAIDAINTTTSAKKAQAKQDLEAAYNAKKDEIAKSALTAEEKATKLAELDKAKEDATKSIDTATTDDSVHKALTEGKSTIAAIDTTASPKKTAAKQDLETAYNAKKAEIENSALTAEEKAAKQAELDKAKEDADKAIDTAPDASGVAKALEDGKSAIDAINTITSAEKAAAKQALEEAYNAKQAEIENSALTAEEKAAKQAELDKAKADADKAIDAATDASGVAKALEAGKSAIDAINTTTSAEKVAAKQALEEAYNAKKAEIENSALTAEEKAAKQAELDKAKEDADKAIDAATDNAGVAKALEAGKSAIDAINTTTSAEKVAAKKDLEAAYNVKKAEIENSALTAEEKAAKQAELDKAKADADKAIDVATDASGVAKALEAGKSAIAGIDTSTSAKKAQGKQDLEVAYNAKKAEIENSALTAEEKAAKQAELDKAKEDATKSIDTATMDDSVHKALTEGKSTIAAIDTSSSAKKAQAKQALEEAYNAKKDEIAKSALTAEEKVAKQAELDQAKSAEDRAIAAATDNAGVARALEASKTAIAGIDTSTSAKKAQAKQDLETAYNAKKEEIAKSALTAEEKAAKQAELDKAKEDADKAIAAATDASGVAKALEAGKTAIAGIDTSSSAKKAQAKQDLETAYNAKKAEIENSALTAEEKAAKQAELDKAKEDADKAIDAATDASGVAKALEAGKTAIAGIDTSSSAKKAQAKQDLETAYNAKKEEIAKSALTAEEKAAKQAELDKAKEDADKAIDVATDASGVAKALEAGEATIDAINTTTSAKKAQAKEELKAVADDAKKAIDANDNLTDAEKAAAKKAVDDEVAKAEKAIDAAKTADAVDAATLVGEKAVAKEELKAAADDAKKAIDENANLTPEEKAAAKAAVDAEVAKANDAIDAATKADEVDAATLVGEKAVAKEELKAAADDAKKAIDANPNLSDAEKQAAKDAVDTEVAKANDAIDAATKADEVDAATLAGEKAVAKEELTAVAEDAKKAIDANDNLSDAEKQAAKDAVEASAATANKAIDGSTSSVEVQAAKGKGNAAIAENVLDAAKQGAKNKLMEEADKAKAAIDANPNLTPEEKAAAKAEIDKAVEEAIIAINGAGTHHALGEIKLPLSALIKPVVTVTPVLDPNNLTEEEIARIKALLEENNTFPEGTEIIVSKDASVSIKYPDGTIDLVLPAEIVKQADTTAPAITDDAKGNIVVAPSEEAVELVVTYVDNNGKAQLVIVTKGADGKWTTTAKAVIVDPVTGQVIIPGSAIKPGTVVTAYSKDMAGNVSDLNSAEVEAVDANNPAAGVKVKSVTSTSNANKSTKKAKQLPNTGEKATSATSLGLAVLGMGLALFAAKRKKDEEEA
ncbi:DUF1542 domain-containing protein [Streptococcus suis]|uniref:DUF1542 domain-containing protein n=1 Tax=Streptococcus suis TaxID=1307 RepID=UPI0028933F01|nr:DUF1542 domain-containing protein [Streptococcus suis]WNF68588.1 DUF1542 domain-containing protein [Streptococcus suis]